MFASTKKNVEAGATKTIEAVATKTEAALKTLKKQNPVVVKTVLGIVTCLTIIGLGSSGLGLTQGDEVECAGTLTFHRPLLGVCVGIAVLVLVVQLIACGACRVKGPGVCKSICEKATAVVNKVPLWVILIGVLVPLAAVAISNIDIYNRKCKKKGEDITGLDVLRIMGIIFLAGSGGMSLGALLGVAAMKT